MTTRRWRRWLWVALQVLGFLLFVGWALALTASEFIGAYW